MTKEEATKILKDFHDKSALFSVRTALETLYPELKESEDKRIKEEIIDYLKQKYSDPNAIKYDYDKWIVWLEKQGECHISHDDEIMIEQLTEYFTTGRGLQNTNETVVEWLNDVKEKLEKQGEQNFAWDEEDEQIRKELTKHLKEGVEGYMPAGDSSDYRRWLDWLEKQCKQKPIIEMKSAEESLGIDSDTYNEIVDECIYGENKPADKVEPKFKVKYAGSEYNVLEIKEIAGDAYYGIEDEPNHIDYVLPDNCEIVSERKSSWSEEDDDDAWMNDIISKVENNLQLNKAEIDWLKSLRPQLKQKWSEEDEEMLRSIIATCELAEADRDSSPARHLLEMQLNWLKSLKPQSQWKPSDEQIEILDMVLTNESMDDNIARILRELREQLKKLKGE